MGRPRKPTPAADAVVSVTASMPAPLVAAVDELAAREQRSRSNTIVVLLQRALQAKGGAA